MSQSMSFRRSVLAVILLSLVATLGVTSLTAAPANAYVTIVKNAVPMSSSPPSSAPCDQIYRDAVVIGKICFAHYGDDIWLIDMKADGAGIYMTGQTSPSEKGFECYNSGGADAGWQRCDFAREMAENPNYLSFFGWARKGGNDSWGWGSGARARTWG